VSVEKPIAEANEIERARQLAIIRDKARIFIEVLNNPRGKLVLAALKAKFSHALPPNVLDNNGQTDPYQTWRRLGHFDVLEYIHSQLEFKE
jgi:hypothetical protein